MSIMLGKKPQTVKFYQVDAGLEKATPTKRRRKTAHNKRKHKNFGISLVFKQCQNAH